MLECANCGTRDNVKYRQSLDLFVCDKCDLLEMSEWSNPTFKRDKEVDEFLMETAKAIVALRGFKNKINNQLIKKICEETIDFLRNKQQEAENIKLLQYNLKNETNMR